MLGSIFSSYASMWKQYCVFRGRTEKTPFWQALFVHLILMAALAALMNYVPTLRPTLSWVLGVYAAAGLLPCAGMAVRRLHDGGKSGRQLFLLLIPVLGLLMVLYQCEAETQPDAPAKR